MRVVGRALSAMTLAGACLAVPAAALAVSVTPEQLISVAGQYKMACGSPADYVTCAPSITDPRIWQAIFWSSADLAYQVETDATEYPLSSSAQSMMVALNDPGCGDTSRMTSFVAETASLTDNQQISADIGDCAVYGKITLPIEGNPTYTVTSYIRVPTSGTTPTPTPTPTPSQRATPSPTVRVTPSATPAPTASATTSGSASASVSSSASASPSDSASPTATATASPTPEQQVAGGQSTPSAQPAGGPGAPLDGRGGQIGRGRLALALVASTAPRFEAAPLAGSALLAILLLLFMAFASELFNSTLESNYDDVAGWLRVWQRRAGAISRVWGGPLGIGLFMILGAVVYGWLDPGFGPDLDSVATLIGLLVGLVVVMITFELPGMLMYRRRTGALPGLRALPWTLAAAAVCVAISRIANLEPGYLYGLLLGIVFAREPSDAEEGRQTAVGAAWTLVVALAAWAALAWVRGNPAPLTGIGGLAVETALAVIVVGGLEAVAFGLLPMRFLAGQALYRWNRPLWAALFGIGTFAFLYLLVGPHTGYLSELPLSGLIAAFGVFAVFGTISVLFWSYFRFRRERPAPA